MIKPYVRKRLISRRDLLYVLYGFTSFATLVGCRANVGSGDKNTTSNNNNTITSNSSNNKPKVIRLLKSWLRTYSDFQVNEPHFFISRKGAKEQSYKEIKISACSLNT